MSHMTQVLEMTAFLKKWFFCSKSSIWREKKGSGFPNYFDQLNKEGRIVAQEQSNGFWEQVFKVQMTLINSQTKGNAIAMKHSVLDIWLNQSHSLMSIAMRQAVGTGWTQFLTVSKGYQCWSTMSTNKQCLQINKQCLQKLFGRSRNSKGQQSFYVLPTLTEKIAHLGHLRNWLYKAQVICDQLGSSTKNPFGPHYCRLCSADISAL